MSDVKRKIYTQLFQSFEEEEQRVFPVNKPALLISDTEWSPPTDILETEHRIWVIVELAGINPENIIIEYKKGFLIIEGNRQDAGIFINEDINYFHKKEIDYGNFKIKVKMTSRINGEQIQAKYQKGFLVIELPKEKTPRKSNDIQIPVNDDSKTNS